jgi:hypothetical protein
MNELPAELIDIVEPAQMLPQAPQYALVMVAVIAVLGIILGVARWWLKNKNRRRTLRSLRRLQRDVSAGRVTARALAYAVAAELRSYVQTHRLHANYPKVTDNDTQRAAWCSFVARLDTLRYQPGSNPEPAQLDALVRDAADWARRLR